MLTGLGLGAACLVCCAPLLLPLVGGAGLAGIGTGIGGAILGWSLEAIICAGIAAAMVAGLVILALRQKSAAVRKGCACEGACQGTSCKAA